MTTGDAPAGAGGGAAGDDPPLRDLVHALNNQLGVILAHSELLQARATDDGIHARAATMVAATLEAMRLVSGIRQTLDR